MKLKLSAIEVPDDDPFLNDRLNRKLSADAICQILARMDEPLVVGICSPWGSGKTTFLKMLRIQLESNGHRSVSLNAWESDFTDNATVSIFSEIERGIVELHNRTKPKSKTSIVMKQLSKAGLELVKTAIPFAVRIASGGVVGLPTDLQVPISEFLGKVAEDQLSAYRDARETIEDFKKKLANALLSEGALPAQKPLVILVDELDRCKPTYAVQFLEVIKHFFNIPQVAFLLAIDETQLTSSIRALYGHGINVNEYLRKFIDLRYHLPQATTDEYVASLFARFDFQQYFTQRAEQIPVYRGDLGEFQQSGRWYFSIFRVSLRAQEQMLSHLSLILRTTPSNMMPLPSVLLLLIVLRDCDNELYLEVIAKKRTARDIVENLVKRNKETNSDSDRLNLEYLEAMLAVVIAEDESAEKEYSSIAEDANADEKERGRASNMLRMIGSINMNYRVGRALSYFSKKVDLMDPFVSWPRPEWKGKYITNRWSCRLRRSSGSNECRRRGSLRAGDSAAQLNSMLWRFNRAKSFSRVQFASWEKKHSIDSGWKVDASLLGVWMACPVPMVA